MEEAERLVREGTFAETLEATAGWSDKQQRAAIKWTTALWKDGREALRAGAKAQGTDAWMRLIVIHVSCAKDAKTALGINAPNDGHWSVSWSVPLQASAQAKAAQLQAIGRRGREFAAAYLSEAANGKKARPVYADLLLALADAFDLPLPEDDYLLEACGTFFKQHVHPQVRLTGEKPPFLSRIACFDVRLAGDRIVAVDARDLEARTPADAGCAISGLQRAVGTMLARRDGALHLLGRYDTADFMAANEPVFAALLERGALDRRGFVDALVGALARGDSVTAQRFQARLLQVAATDDGLLRPHLQALGSMLGTANTTAADIVQTLLAQQDAQQPLAPELFLSASQMVFARKEKGLRQAQLAWAGKRAMRMPQQMGATLQAIAEALLVDEFALQKEAVALLLAHWNELAADQREPVAAAIRAAEGALDAKLRAQLADKLGDTSPAAAAAPVVAPIVTRPPAAPRGMPAPAPLTLLADIAGDARPYLDALDTVRGQPTVAAIEQLLDFAVRASRDAQATLPDKLVAILRLAMRAESRANLLQVHVDAEHAKQLDWQQRYSATSTPALMAVATLRAAEAAEALVQRARYPLLSRPTHANGAIDAVELARRLLLLPAAEAVPPLDLLLALLRTTAPDDETLRTLRAMPHPAARIAADFLAAGGVGQITTGWDVSPPDARGEREVRVRLGPAAVLPAIEGIPLSWARGFEAGAAPDIRYWHVHEEWLSGVLPNHAEILAAWHIAGFRRGSRDFDTDGGKDFIMRLPLFLAAGGPAGPALHLAVLYSVSANDPAARIVGSDGLLTLIGQGRLDEALACELLAATIRCGSVKATRLAAGLARVVDAGEAVTTWPLLRTAVVAALEQETPPPGTPDLLALATRVAQSLGRKDSVPVLAQTAQRKGSGKLLVEARRLHEQLA